MPRQGPHKLLVVTDPTCISAVLFHGLGLPPWYDLPRVQNDPQFRRDMTARINAFVPEAAAAGFRQVEVHEAFPVDLFRLHESVRVVRGAVRFLPERAYAGVALLRHPCRRGLRRQPRLLDFRRMTLNGLPLTEIDIIAWFWQEQGVPLVYSDLRGAQALPRRRARFGNDLTTGPFPTPARFEVAFADGVPAPKAAGYPGVAETGDHSVCGAPRNAAHLLEIYKYCGLLVQVSGRY